MPGEMQTHCPGPLRDSRAAVMPTPFGNMVTLKFILILVAHLTNVPCSDGAAYSHGCAAPSDARHSQAWAHNPLGKERLTNPLAAD